MASKLAPPPYQTAMVDGSGIITTAWSQWFNQLFTRVGGQNALSNTELNQSTAITDLQDTTESQASTLTNIFTEVDALTKGRAL